MNDIISTRIKEARIKKSLKQKDLADKIGVDTSQYSKIESGKLMPTLSQLVEISSILDASIDWLWGKSNTDIKKNLIPLYNDVASIGGTQLIADSTAVSTVTEYIDVGDLFPGATAAIRHYGDSMKEYPSGSILAIKKVEDKRLIAWGKNYCIETSEYRITKALIRSKDKDMVWGYSSNRDTWSDGELIHPPIPIPEDAIRSLFLVLGYFMNEFSSVKSI